MATDYKALGKRISNARKQAGITQEALGEQLNMTRKHISVIESAIKRPSLDALVDIANALDVSTDDLLVDPSFFLTHRVFIWRGYWSACFGAFVPFHSNPPALPSQVYPAAFKELPFSVSRI